MRLRCTSLQADNALLFYRAVAEYVADALGAELCFDDHLDWTAREARLDAGDIDLAFVCGGNYVAHRDAGQRHLELAAAPVPAAVRYGDRPVYFSDVLVRRDSDLHDFPSLRGRRWAYNEPGSHSGYTVTLYHLAQLGETGAFFGSAVEAGSHQRALELLLAGEIDAASIDSYVLELETAQRPELETALRCVATFGPSPSPPVVLRAGLPAEQKERIGAALAGMHADERGRHLLAEGRVRRYQRVGDADYDPIRRMAQAARGLQL